MGLHDATWPTFGPFSDTNSGKVRGLWEQVTLPAMGEGPGACRNAYAEDRRHVTYQLKKKWSPYLGPTPFRPILPPNLSQPYQPSSSNTHASMGLCGRVRTWCACEKISPIELALISNLRFDSVPQHVVEQQYISQSNAYLNTHTHTTELIVLG